MKLKNLLSTLFFTLISVVCMAADDDAAVTEEYIAKYRDVAIREMKAYGIPASITLAQGILESGSGQSYLATRANNHFGIKCHLDWSGKRVYHDDDEKNECFRAYKDPDESFRDHSLFLKNRSRYAFLFEESPTDYKAWAHGLKKAGYATNNKYPKLLIELIERYELHKYDLDGFDVNLPASDKKESSTPVAQNEVQLETSQIQVSLNKVKYVVAKEGDTFESIAEATERFPRELLKYNELEKGAQVEAGQRIYLQPKRKKGSRDHAEHKAEKGETMYSISQRFGIKLKHLYKHNNMQPGEEPVAGETIWLR